MIAETGNYSEGLLAQTSVYYGTASGEQETAESVADASESPRSRVSRGSPIRRRV